MGAETFVGRSHHELSPERAWYTALPILYAIHNIGSITDAERNRLCNILNISTGSWATSPIPDTIYVTPRPGMKTPSSSKITDALRACGIHAWQVEKIFQYGYPENTPISSATQNLVDRMQQVAASDLDKVDEVFNHGTPGSIKHADILNGGIDALKAFNASEKFWLNDNQLHYLFEVFSRYGRNPSDVELMSFAQANSEHCRHGTFNAEWTIDGVKREYTMFQHIRSTHQAQIALLNHTTLSAYTDNAAVFLWGEGSQISRTPEGKYEYRVGLINMLGKVETHNHPTSISPFPWAATGSGGEIRDEWSVGRGARPKAGLTGFMTSHLRIPGFEQPWEKPIGKPWHVESALGIMTAGPLGWAAFNNEFGRPNLTGHFRTFGMKIWDTHYGYHKPIMLAGGIGSVLPVNEMKIPEFPKGTLFVQLGWPGLPVGIGWWNASSQNLGTWDVNLDFASVQRENPEMQRRAQEVITACATLGESNPILSIHDVWAGWVGNALPELAHSGWVWAIFDLRSIPSEDASMSPREIWSNEAQERYVLAILPEKLAEFKAICKRERAPFAVVGYATEEKNIIVNDGDTEVMNMTVADLLEAKVLTHITATRQKIEGLLPLNLEDMPLSISFELILKNPTVADKTWLINIGDRTVGWLTARDQMVWPWQVPVADVAVTLRDHIGFAGEAMATGERTPLSIMNPEAAARMALGEAITNMLAADIRSLEEMKFSGNWMAAMKNEGEKTKLYDAVVAISELCKTIGVAIPVGKDSLSMETTWSENGERQTVTSPVSPIITGFAPVNDVRKTLTPELKRGRWSTELLLLDLGRWRNRLGGSIFAQVWNKYGNEVPDIDAETLKAFAEFMLELHSKWLMLAYHDRGDGGLYTTLLEMAFASHSGLRIDLSKLGSEEEIHNILFSEELGAVMQVSSENIEEVRDIARNHGLLEHTHTIGEPEFRNEWIELNYEKRPLLFEKRGKLHQKWSETSYRMQALRDNPILAKEEFDRIARPEPMMPMKLTFDVSTHLAHAIIAKSDIEHLPKPKVAILREQWVNGHEEMAAAFMRAWFDAIDVTMTDLIEERKYLKDYQGLAACGGFSFGDVMWAGRAWAQVILNNDDIRSQFEEFFQRHDTFGIGVCNGNQMLSQLKFIIPGASHWPTFSHNDDGRFKARYSPVKIGESPSIFLNWMGGSIIPMVSAHGEWKASGSEWSVMQYVNNRGYETHDYPENPNGSPDGATGFTTTDGRFTTMMPHPERVVRAVQCSWLPDDYTDDDAPWMHAFYNLRVWAEENKRN